MFHPQITEFYAFLPREAVTKFLTQCSECRRSMKSPLVQEIFKTDELEGEETKKICDDTPTSNNQQQQLTLPGVNSPKNIENYFVLLKALYENSSLLNRIKGIQQQSCEKKFESFKENIIVNQAIKNKNSNQQEISRKNINISIKNELDNSVKPATGVERSLGNIIINSLDVSINVAGKTNYDGDHGNISNVHILCTTSPTKKVLLPLASPDNQQLVTSSSSEPGDEDENCANTNALSSSSMKTNNNNNSASENINDGPTRAVCSSRVEVETVPDDISFDYRNIKYYSDDDKHTTSTTCNNNSAKYPNGEDDAGDYHTKDAASIDTVKRNKHNNSTGDIKPITSTYLLMTRSMGLTDDEALNLVSGIMCFLLFANLLKKILRS